MDEARSGATRAMPGLGVRTSSLLGEGSCVQGLIFVHCKKLFAPLLPF